MTAHIVPVKKYVYVLVALLILTLVTTEVAKVDLGPFSVVVALFIAGCKMMIVVLFFMHMMWSSARMKVVAGAGVLWLLILISLTLADYLTRRWLPLPGGW